MENKNFWWTMGCVFILLILLIILVLVNSMDTKDSSSATSDVKNATEYMKENKLVIYGSTKCSYCQKQLKEFEPNQVEAIEQGVFIFCDQSQDIGCIGLNVVPTWKQDGKIVYEGYLPLKEIKDVL